MKILGGSCESKCGKSEEKKMNIKREEKDWEMAQIGTDRATVYILRQSKRAEVILSEVNLSCYY